MENLTDALGITSDFGVMTLRIFIAGILSGLIGLEREFKHQPAGFRTHLLVGIGSCLMMLLSIYGFEHYLYEQSNVRYDPARIPSYVISGIGFLGAGTIIVRGATIKGLTTAASIWVVAGIGLVAGNGMYAIGFITTVIVVISLRLLNLVENRWMKSKSVRILNIYIKGNSHVLSDIISLIERKGMKVHHIVAEREADLVKFGLEIDSGTKEMRVQLLEGLTELEYITRVQFHQ